MSVGPVLWSSVPVAGDPVAGADGALDGVPEGTPGGEEEGAAPEEHPIRAIARAGARTRVAERRERCDMADRTPLGLARFQPADCRGWSATRFRVATISAGDHMFRANSALLRQVRHEERSVKGLDGARIVSI